MFFELSIDIVLFYVVEQKQNFYTYIFSIGSFGQMICLGIFTCFISSANLIYAIKSVTLSNFH